LKLGSVVAACALLLAGCDKPKEVSHPFYLWYLDDPTDVSLFRCPSGPDGGCAVDGLPLSHVVAAGANKNFIVVEQMQPGGVAGYFYFARVPEETRGWGNNPEVIIGPLSSDAFAEAKTRLQLPELSVRR
jgi:hypothetical protein